LKKSPDGRGASSATIKSGDPAALLAGLERFIGSLDRGAVADALASQTPRSQDRGGDDDLLDTYLNEAPVGLELVAPYLSVRPRMLEVGSGIGILTHFLHSRGFDITGIEPGAAGGFAAMTAMSTAVARALAPEARGRVLPIAAADLRPAAHGTFGLIFSVNVLEHVMTLDDTFAALASVLAPSGRMIHLCPNYAFPYEPHLAIPLVPGAPRLTRHLLPSTIDASRAIWSTLNFITAARIARLARRHGLRARFLPGVMATYFRRLREDDILAARHSRLVSRIARAPAAGALLEAVLRAIPPRLATPMVIDLTHAGTRPGASDAGQSQPPPSAA